MPESPTTESKLGNKKLTWTFKGLELYNDIAEIAYLEGYVMNDENTASKHSTQDIMADGNRDIVVRAMDKSAAEAAEFMHAYTSDEVGKNSLTGNNDLSDTEEFADYTFYVNVPEHFSKTTQNKAVALVHDYIVYRTMEEFFNIVNPEAAAKCHAKSEASAAELNICMHKRTRPTRIVSWTIA